MALDNMKTSLALGFAALTLTGCVPLLLGIVDPPRPQAPSPPNPWPAIPDPWQKRSAPPPQSPGPAPPAEAPPPVAPGLPGYVPR
jgi:hypothetical protein